MNIKLLVVQITTPTTTWKPTVSSLRLHDTQQALLWLLPAILITLRLSATPLILRPSLISSLLVFRAGNQPQSARPAERENDKLQFFPYFMWRKLFCERSGLCSGISLRGRCSFHVASSKPSEGSVYLNLLLQTCQHLYEGGDTRLTTYFKVMPQLFSFFPHLWNDSHCLLVIPEASHIDIFVQHFADSINHMWIIDKPRWGNNDTSSLEQTNDPHCKAPDFIERENESEWTREGRRLEMKNRLQYYGILRTVFNWI